MNFFEFFEDLILGKTFSPYKFGVIVASDDSLIWKTVVDMPFYNFFHVHSSAIEKIISFYSVSVLQIRHFSN